MSAQVKMDRFPHKRATGCREEKEFSRSCCLRKDGHTQGVQVLIALPGRRGDIPLSLVF